MNTASARAHLSAAMRELAAADGLLFEPAPAPLPQWPDVGVHLGPEAAPAPVAPRAEVVPRWGISPDKTPPSTPPRAPGAYPCGIKSRIPLYTPEHWVRYIEAGRWHGVYGSRALALSDPHPEDQAEQSPVYWRDVIVEWV